jgi:hypothetical protein
MIKFKGFRPYVSSALKRTLCLLTAAALAATPE